MRGPNRRIPINLVVLGVLALSSLQAQPERPQFGNFGIAAGSQPRGIAMADFDGDGRLDVVTGQGECPTVAISFGTPDDYLSPAVPVGFDCHGRNVATGDFNGDGTLDLASTSEPGEVFIHLGNGDGTFVWPPDVYSIGDFNPPIVVGDFTGNGFDDVITANTGNTPLNLWLLEGNGDGTLGSPTNLIQGKFDYIVVGLLNADTHLDLVTADRNNGSSVKVFLGDGLGGFAAPVDYNVGGALVLADLDGDGDDDLATTRPSGQISVLEGNGDGTFEPPIGYATTGAGHSQITAADLDGDGALELVAAGDGALTILPGIGDGSFDTADTYSWPSYAWSIAVADLNEDGKPDVFGGDSIGSMIRVMPGLGDGTVLNRVFELEWDPASGSSGLHLADVDLDGRQDAVIIQGSSPGVFPLYGNADGSFEPGVSVTSLAGIVDATVGEFGVNATQDLVILADPSTPGPAAKALWVLFGLSPRTYLPSEVEGPAVSDDPSTLTVADLDGDGETDVLVTDEVTDEVIVMMGLGNVQFASPFPTYPVGSAPVALALQRLDADPHLDLVVANRDSDNVAVLRGNGDGTFMPATFVATGPSPSSINLADLNDDGIRDLVVTNQPPGQAKDVTVRLGNGDGTFGADLRFPSGIYSNNSLVADFDRDGHVDLALGGLNWYRGNGDGTFEIEPRGRHATGSGLVAALDVDRDGWIDIVSEDLVLLNQGGPGMVAFEPDGETLRWPGVLGADSYNLYRGDISLLVDVNTDGLPDGGFGVCLSGADPDPTDTIFSDPDVPTVGGDGFFYIRSVVSAVSEDLGNTSGGLVRVPSVFCP